MANVDVYSLVVELTARCNMRCAHCMRGEPRNEDITDEVIDATFSKVNKVNTLCLTGGEPSLVPRKIHAVMDAIERHGVYVGNVYIVTNGKRVSNEFLAAAKRMYQAIPGDGDLDDEYDIVSELRVSNDVWHEMQSASGIKKLKRMCEQVGVRFGYKDNKHPKAIGRAVDIRNDGVGANFFGFGLDEYDGKHYVDTICIDRKGRILCHCDYSFEISDQPRFSAGNILRVPDLLTAIKGWERRHPNGYRNVKM